MIHRVGLEAFAAKLLDRWLFLVRFVNASGLTWPALLDFTPRRAFDVMMIDWSATDDERETLWPAVYRLARKRPMWVDPDWARYDEETGDS